MVLLLINQGHVCDSSVEGQVLHNVPPDTGQTPRETA